MHSLSGEAGTGLALNRAVQFLTPLFNLFFPDRCRLCQNLLEEITRVPVCSACWQQLPAPADVVCLTCGLPAPSLTVVQPWRCQDCEDESPGYELARSAGAYQGALRELIHLFKYQGMTPLAVPLGERMVNVARSGPWAESFAPCQAVVAVPLDTSRRRARGYNQAELLAEVVARRLEIALLRRACHRSRPTTPQSGLSKAQRRTNVHEAFQADRRLVEGRMILLVDDVMTTGATVNACALALLAAGAARVAVLTAARTPGMA